MWASVLVCAALLGASAPAYAQRSNIDTVEPRTTPVPHTYVHGTLGDADFTVVLPVQWNGKLLIGARGWSGDELGEAAFRTNALRKGYAFTLSDQGWFRNDIIDNPEDKYFESRRRLVQLTHYVKAYVRSHYGSAPTRTFMIGGSNGGHNAKMMVEDYPGEYDGAIAGFGITTHIEWMASNARFLRNYDVFGPRIASIVAARTANPNWNPATMPLNPALTPEQITALLNVYTMPATVGGIDFNIGRYPGSEYRWAGQYNAILAYLTTALAKMDRFYDPDGDGTLTIAESKLWDPDFSPPPVANDMRRLDNTGRLTKPVLIMHGADDPIVSPGETLVYKQLVESRLGLAESRELLAVYFIPRMGHGGFQYDNLIGAQLDALEAWVDYLQSKGKKGALPPAVLGVYPRN
jgi:pimeloyl-ACP methyl ester carboxylesterase